MDKRGAIAITQILILVVSVIAISGIVGAQSATPVLVPARSNVVSSNQRFIDAGYKFITSLGEHEVEQRVLATTDGKYFGYLEGGWHPAKYNSKDKQFVIDVNEDAPPLDSAGKFLKVLDTSKSPTDQLPEGVSSEDGKETGAETNIIGTQQGGIIDNAFHSLQVFGLVQGVGRIFLDDEKNVNAFSLAASAGLFVGRTVSNQIKNEGWGENIFSIGGRLNSGTAGLLWGGGTALVIFLSMYKKESEEVVTFQCFPWQPPKGGDQCEQCNKQSILPCSRYQCKSLGQSCELLNDGETGKELCTYVNRRDVDQPVIKPWHEILLEDQTFVPNQVIQPPDRGVKLIDKTTSQGCVKAFTPLRLGIEVNEPARCKLDNVATKEVDEMRFFFGGDSLFKYNHSMVMALPGPNALNNESPTLQNDGEYNLFVKCIDANGNDNKANFVFNFCVEAGPDTTPPVIVSTSISNGAPIGFNTTKVDLDVYVNEPSSCKWSKQDKPFEEMDNSMSCSSSVFEMNAQMLYTCKTTLDGIKDREENTYYFRCEDQPRENKNDRNVNRQSHVFTLLGTQPLLIDALSPNETIKDSTDPARVVLEAKTSQGHDEGRAACYFSDKGFDDANSFVKFGNSDSHVHSQILNLPEGVYNYFIKCIDLGGNQDSGEINFNVEIDKAPPSVVRIFKDENSLRIITDEEAECRYGIESCSFTFLDGILMRAFEDTQHFADWNTNLNYHIKCADIYGNQPLPNECNIIARPFEVAVV
jgi:hypothetical protein